MPDSTALARRSLCYLGQVMSWDSFILPYTSPSDRDGLRGPPCAVPLVIPRGGVARLREDLKIPISHVTSTVIPSLRSHFAFVSYVKLPTVSWPPSRAP